jgi:hypothetical protein
MDCLNTKGKDHPDTIEALKANQHDLYILDKRRELRDEMREFAEGKHSEPIA